LCERLDMHNDEWPERWGEGKVVQGGEKRESEDKKKKERE
jgi:hypothetical protein